MKKYFKIPKYKGAGIYGVVNIEDMKIYIGQTTNVHNRAKQHLQSLEHKSHHNTELQKDSDKSLRFLVLYEVPDSEIKYLKLLEKLYMLEAHEKGYKLYNIQGSTEVDELSKSIVNDALYYFNTNRNIENAILKEYKSHTWNIKNMKYRHQYFCG